MFPLGSVLLPGQLLPLHIFEARYQLMLEHCRAHGDEFGVVLIERGHEVGGGDIRSGVGTVARILDVSEAAPGHWALVAAGVRRIRVQRWHPDEPWPHADVEPLVDSDGTGPGEVAPELRARWNGWRSHARPRGEGGGEGESGRVCAARVDFPPVVMPR